MTKSKLADGIQHSGHSRRGSMLRPWTRMLTDRFKLTFYVPLRSLKLKMVPVRGYAKGGNAENVAFVGIAA
jgi:hypothetical protein